MGKISINELNDNLKQIITGSDLKDEEFLDLVERANSNIDRLQAVAATGENTTYIVNRLKN